jgi:hypothetical protein
LPSRKIKKKSADRGGLSTLAGFKSTANLPDALLTLDAGLSINAALLAPRRLGLQPGSKQQSLPLPPIPAPKPKPKRGGGGGDLYRPSSVLSRSSCSTTENKYETIGKSLSPYKIAADAPKTAAAAGKASASALRSSLDSASFSSSGSPSADSDQGYGFASSSVSPMSLGNRCQCLGQGDQTCL